MSAFRELESAERRRLAQLGAFLFIVGSATAVPAGLFLEPPPPATDHIISVIGVAFGVLFLMLPWERMSSNWLHAIPIIGGIEVIAAVAVFSIDFAIFYVLGAMYIAYTVRDTRFLAAYMTFYVLSLLSPLVYMNSGPEEQVHLMLVILPVLLITAAVVRYLRDTLEKREDEYRVFAYEAIALAERIRGEQRPGRHIAATAGLEERLDALSEKPAKPL